LDESYLPNEIGMTGEYTVEGEFISQKQGLHPQPQILICNLRAMILLGAKNQQGWNPRNKLVVHIMHCLCIICTF